MNAPAPLPSNNTAAAQRILSDLVRREVKACVTSLVTDLADSNPDEWTEHFSQPDYKTPCQEAGWVQETDDDGDSIFRDTETGEVCTVYDADDWSSLAHDYGIDPEYPEIFEYWIVTDWAADRLRERGEIVADDFRGLTVWGRQTTGQAIALDHVWLEIAREMEILPGQANDWSRPQVPPEVLQELRELRAVALESGGPSRFLLRLEALLRKVRS